MLGSNLQKRPSRRQVLVEKGVTMLYEMCIRDSHTLIAHRFQGREQHAHGFTNPGWCLAQKPAAVPADVYKRQFQEAYTYMGRGKVFANAQTGNIVLMATNLEQWYRPLTAMIVYGIAAFAVHYGTCKNRNVRLWLSGQALSLIHICRFPAHI